MLTIDQKVEMYRMRLEGKSYQAIADRCGRNERCKANNL